MARRTLPGSRLSAHAGPTQGPSICGQQAPFPPPALQFQRWSGQNRVGVWQRRGCSFSGRDGKFFPLNFERFAMRFSAEKAGSRREFFRAAARYSLLALASVAACLTTRKPRLAGQECVNRGICSGCGVFASCGLPQALSAKNARRDHEIHEIHERRLL